MGCGIDYRFSFRDTEDADIEETADYGAEEKRSKVKEHGR